MALDNKKLISLDILRAIAASFVFFFHHNIGKLLVEKTGINTFYLIDVIGAKYSVPVFFILSGYCIEFSVQNSLKRGLKFNLSNFYKRRIKRIYIPYLGALLFSIVVNYIADPNYNLGLIDLLTHLIVGQGFSNTYFNSINLVFWTITIELSFYLLYPIYYYIKCHVTEQMTLFIISTISSLSIIVLMQRFGASSVTKYFPTNLLSSWCFGCSLFHLTQYKSFNMRSKYFARIASFTLIPLIFTYLIFPSARPTLNYNFTIILSSIILLLFLHFETAFSPRNIIVRILVWIGISSYSLYLLHIPLNSLKALISTNFVPNPFKDLFHIFGIVFIYILSYFSYLLIEKPVLKKK